MKSIQHFLQKPWLYLLILLIGISLKFYNVNYRYFWFDEICTIQHTSGNQIIHAPFNEIRNITFFTDQLWLKSQGQSISSQLNGLYSSANLNPLHYSFLMIWYRIAGDSTGSYRYFNIFIFLLTLPVLFLLSRKLFNSVMASWIIVSLYAVSPFIHYYVHEARYNILLLFLISLSHLFLLEACEKKKAGWWIGYSLAGILSLYASVMSGLVLFGHGIYIWFFRKKNRIRFIMGFGAILLGYLPWIISMINNRQEILTSLAWHRFNPGWVYFLKILPFQLTGFSNVFVNFTPASVFALISYNFEGIRFQFLIKIVIAAFIIITIIYTFRRSTAKASFFVLLIILPHWLFYYISDIVRGAAGSLFERYQNLNFIGILLFVAYFLGRKIDLGKYFYSSLYILIIIIGFISIRFISRDPCWHVPLDCKGNIREAELFSEAEHPLLITDYTMRLGVGIGGFFTLLNRCESENIDVLPVTPDNENIINLIGNKDYSDIYVTHASNELVENLKSQFGERMDSLEIENISSTWQIKTN